MSALFWPSLAFIAYVYALFPLLLKALAGARRATAPEDSGRRSVSVIVAAHNEERVIAERVRNLLAMDHPKDSLEVIVASDGSTDRTAERARAAGARALELPRGGRPAAHNAAAAQAKGEILVFTDAETSFEPDFLARALKWFADPSYGCGAGDYTFAPRGAIGREEGLYWRMEKEMRRLEFELGVLPFASGGCFLVRREAYSPVPAHSDIDCWLPYRVLEAGGRVFYAADAKASDVTVADAREHFRKRRRTAQKGLSGALAALGPLARTGRWGALWVLVSHRVLRWLCPPFFLALLAASAAGDGPFQRVALAAQLAFYGAAAVGGLLPGSGRVPAAAYGFVLANAAFLGALVSVLKGDREAYYLPVSQS